MPMNPRPSVRTVNQSADLAWDSGPLGPLDAPFAEAMSTSTPVPPVSFADAQQQFEQEQRYLQERLRDLTELLQQSEAHKAELVAKEAALAEQVHGMEAALTQYGRPQIMKSCQDLGEAQTALVEMRETCVRLQAQLETNQRALQSVRLALRVVVEAERRQRAHEEALEAAQVAPASVKISSASLHPATLTTDFQALLTAREQERHAVARHIEERICASLYKAVSRGEHFDAILKNEPGRAGEVVAMFKNRLNQALHEARMLSFELEPYSLGEYGLATTLETYIHDIIETRNLAIVAQIETADRHYPPAIENAIFHVAREALANIVRHACAAHVRVSLRQDAAGVILTVQDDGVGFAVNAVTEQACQAHSGLGQLGQEAEMLGATLVIESGPGKGTRIDYIVATTSMTSSSIL